MSGISWTDVRPTIPQPIEAHDAQSGNRRVEARMWQTSIRAATPYQLEFRLWEHGQLIETWTHDYGTGSGFGQAIATYHMTRATNAERYLEGETPERARPKKRLNHTTWVFTKHGAP